MGVSEFAFIQPLLTEWKQTTKADIKNSFEFSDQEETKFRSYFHLLGFFNFISFVFFWNDERYRRQQMVVTVTDVKPFPLNDLIKTYEHRWSVRVCACDVRAELWLPQNIIHHHRHHLSSLLYALILCS